MTRRHPSIGHRPPFWRRPPPVSSTLSVSTSIHSTPVRLKMIRCVWGRCGLFGSSCLFKLDVSAGTSNPPWCPDPSLSELFYVNIAKVSIMSSDPNAVPLDEALYRIDNEAQAFMQGQTGIQDTEELKRHILAVQAKAYSVSSYIFKTISGSCSKALLFCRSTPIPAFAVSHLSSKLRRDGPSPSHMRLTDG